MGGRARARDQGGPGPGGLGRDRHLWTLGLAGAAVAGRLGLRYRRGGVRGDESERRAQREEGGDDDGPQLLDLVPGHDPLTFGLGDLRTFLMMCMGIEKGSTDARGASMF
ncbi:hypothetical protein GCM10020256_37550 [Streptomyces thermocoprophilus]